MVVQKWIVKLVGLEICEMNKLVTVYVHDELDIL